MRTAPPPVEPTSELARGTERPAAAVPHTFTYAELLEILAARESEPPVETPEPTLTEDDLDRMFG